MDGHQPPGLARYSESKQTWAYFTRARRDAKLDQAQAMAFDQQGNIYVGTQCDRNRHRPGLPTATDNGK